MGSDRQAQYGRRVSTAFNIASRPVSESESERQRARNGASESERDFSRERATIHTSESKRAKFRMGRDFSFYSPLQWSNDDCGIYRTQSWEPSLSPVSIVSTPALNKHGLFIVCLFNTGQKQ